MRRGGHLAASKRAKARFGCGSTHGLQDASFPTHGRAGGALQGRDGGPAGRPARPRRPAPLGAVRP